MFLHLCLVLISVFGLHSCDRGAALECGNRTKSLSYLEVAVDMISKARDSYPNCSVSKSSCASSRPLDCEELLRSGKNRSGVYVIWPRSRISDGKPLEVYCDMITDGGGWTVIQRRGNYLRPVDYFYKDWASYKSGFGDIEKDFWLGNDNIFALTNQRLYSVRFDLQDVAGLKKYAFYDTFWIDDEVNKYTLRIKDYSGDAGDSMVEHNNMKFSTKDAKNDNHKNESCAQKYKGGWWYNSCHSANLNALYLNGKHKSFADGVNWRTWKGHNESLRATEIKIRPKNFRKNLHQHQHVFRGNFNRLL